MSKFTPGKWEARPNRVIANGRPLAIVNGGNSANTRLMAAAPEMYELLIFAMASLRDGDIPAQRVADSIYELLAEIDDEPVETRKYSSSFFQNRNCEYFPCHDGADPDKFSCLFCFCPLYHMEKCPGTPRTLSNGVKDCSCCTWPHAQYEDVIRMLRYEEVIRVLREKAKHEQA